MRIQPSFGWGHVVSFTKAVSDEQRGLFNKYIQEHLGAGQVRIESRNVAVAFNPNRLQVGVVHQNGGDLGKPDTWEKADQFVRTQIRAALDHVDAANPLPKGSVEYYFSPHRTMFEPENNKDGTFSLDVPNHQGYPGFSCKYNGKTGAFENIDIARGVATTP